MSKDKDLAVVAGIPWSLEYPGTVRCICTEVQYMQFSYE